MQTTERIKEIVKEKYGEIARKQEESSCCGPSCCSSTDSWDSSEDYSKLQGYTKEADLHLGCGMPTQVARISAGDTVVDLGSGAGNDVFVARTLAGESGKVIGIDMTKDMIVKARKNNAKLGFNNVEFRLGEIEALPLDENTADVVISNCVLNLVPDKRRAFGEIYRILKPGGHFSISDIVLRGELPASIQSAAEMYAGCIAGAIQRSEYLNIMSGSGFENVNVATEKTIVLPDEILRRYLTAAELEQFKKSGTAIISITVYGEKPR